MEKERSIRRYDALVVGGGPAGAVSAVRMHQAGLSVCLVSKPARFLGTCGRAETVHATTLALLQQLGFTLNSQRDYLKPLEAVISHWERPQHLSFEAQPRYVLDRPAFDYDLCESAQNVGVEVLRRAARDVKPLGAEVSVSLDDGSLISSQYVLDASGRGARWARRAGARAMQLDQLTALSAVYPENGANTRLMIEATQGGWLVGITDRAGQDQVSFFTDRTRIGPEPLKVQMNAHLASSKLFRRFAGREHQNLRLWPAGVRTLRHAVRGRVIAVGDAAQTTDPLSGSGIGAAIEGSLGAANAVVAATRSGPQAFASYERSRCAEFIMHLRLREAYYKGVIRPEDGFWRAKAESRLGTAERVPG